MELTVSSIFVGSKLLLGSFCVYFFFFIFCPIFFSVSSDSSSLKTPNLSRLDNTVQDFNLFKLTIISTIRNGISVVNSVLKPYGHHTWGGGCSLTGQSQHYFSLNNRNTSFLFFSFPIARFAKI